MKNIDDRVVKNARLLFYRVLFRSTDGQVRGRVQAGVFPTGVNSGSTRRAIRQHIESNGVVE